MYIDFYDNPNKEKNGERDLRSSLSELVQLQPELEFLDLSNQGIVDLDELSEHLAQFTNLRELSLEDNDIQKLSAKFSASVPKISVLNLNGNDLSPFEEAIDHLQELTEMRSLFLNLVEESQVDYVMRALPELEELNGLPVERDLVEDDDEGVSAQDGFEELGEIKEAGKESSKNEESEDTGHELPNEILVD
jgi:Leucine-rich repeat (LRR) protein